MIANVFIAQDIAALLAFGKDSTHTSAVAIVRCIVSCELARLKREHGSG